MCQICQQTNPFAGDWLHGEGATPAKADLPADASTPATLKAGQTTASHLGVADEDWIRLTVSKGNSYVLTTSDGASGSVADTLLVLYDRNGNQVGFDDDSGPDYHAQIGFEAKDSVYYAAVTTSATYYGRSDTDQGSYVLRLAGAGTPADGDLPTYTTRQIARQLARDYWENKGEAARGFDLSVDKGKEATIHVDTSGLSASGAWFAAQAMAVWSAVTGLTFSDKAPPRGTPVGILFDDENSGAYASTTLYENGATANVFVNISRQWIAGEYGERNSYALQTYIHEIGHALGLGHAGTYNVGDGVSITYEKQAEYVNDSWQTTVMSYFSQIENASTDGSFAYLLTPAAADILAIQSLYGTAGDLRTGNTVYGDGSTAGDYYDNLEGNWGRMAFTLLDDGGQDTLNFGSATETQAIRLRPDSFSSVGGAIGNMSIAPGTMIENAISGAGNDRIFGNGAANRIEGGAGRDRIEGGGGRDHLIGDQGNDRMRGGAAADRLEGGQGNDRLWGNGGHDKLHGGAGDDLLTGGGGADSFRFARGDGKDVITDWQDGVDQLDLRSWGLDGFADLHDLAREKGSALELGFDDGSRLTIDGLDLDRFGASDVLF